MKGWPDKASIIHQPTSIREFSSKLVEGFLPCPLRRPRAVPELPSAVKCYSAIEVEYPSIPVEEFLSNILPFVPRSTP